MMSTPQAHNAFLSYLKVEKGLSPLTVQAYRGDLLQLAEFLEKRNRTLLNATRRDLLAFLEQLTANMVEGRSRARKLSALRHFYKFLLLDNKIKHDPTLNIESPRQWKILPKSLAVAEIDAMLAHEKSKPQDPPLAIRNEALLELLYATGMRVSEIVNLRLEDLNLQASSAIVRGKGDKERIVPFGVAARDALQRYLRDARPQLCKLQRSPLVFVDRSGTGLTRERVWRIVREAKVDGKASPHMLRHSCATHMVGNGADLRTVQTILGHADIATTQVYTHVAMDRLKSVYRAHHPRSKRRFPAQKERA
jgi:integrase/recombinase XerD